MVKQCGTYFIQNKKLFSIIVIVNIETGLRNKLIASLLQLKNEWNYNVDTVLRNVTCKSLHHLIILHSGFIEETVKYYVYEA